MPIRILNGNLGNIQREKLIHTKLRIMAIVGNIQRQINCNKVENSLCGLKRGVSPIFLTLNLLI